jgi:cardiolipin synthase
VPSAEPVPTADSGDGGHGHSPSAGAIVGEIVHDRILTVPNAITLARLLLLPVYLWLLLGRDDRVGAAVLLGAIGATDWCDGFIARRFNQVSKLGKVFDPTVDRLLFFVGIGGILAVDGAPRWLALAVLIREVIVASITVTITALGARPVNVTWFGKAGTFALMCAFPFFLAGSGADGWSGFWIAGWVFGVPGLALSLYAAVAYVPLWRENLNVALADRSA